MLQHLQLIKPKTATCYPRDELVTIGSSPTGRGKHFGKNSPRLCLPRDGSVTPLL